MKQDEKIHSSIHSKEIEELILGQSIHFERNKDKAVSILKKQDFFFKNHKLIFELISNSSEKITSIVSILENAKKNGLYNEDLLSCLVNMLHKNSIEIDISSYILILREKTISRKIISFLNNSICNLKDFINSPDKLLEDYKNRIEEISSFLDVKKSFRKKKLSNVIVLDRKKTFFEEIKERFLRNINGKGFDFLKTGFYCLDSKASLLNNSNLVILAARPAIGKTSFALNIALNLSMRKIPIGFFSLEMSSIQIAERIISMLSKVSCERIRRGTFSETELSKIEIAEKNLKSLPFFIFDYSCSSISNLLKEIKELKREEDVKIIFIDYLQLLHSNKNYENRQGEVAEISRKLKLLAVELDIPIFCLSQLSRKVEERQDKRPVISDLRDSGQIEQDADVVMFLYNRDQQCVNQDKSRTVEVFLGKNRHGCLFSSFLNFEADFGIFEGIDNEW